MKLFKSFKQFFRQQEDAEIVAKIRAATQLCMDDDARERTRALLSEYVKMRPSAERGSTEASRPNVRPVRTAAIPAYDNAFSAFFVRHSAPAFAMVFVLLIGGGTAAAAEGSLPGDLLYPIKVHVNEETRAMLSTSPKAKADWEVVRAERRLEEAAALALSGKLDEATRAELDENLDAHVKVASESRRKLAGENNASDASDIDTSIHAVLIARENILDGKRVAKAKAAARLEAATLMTSAPASSAEVSRGAALQEDDAETKGNRTAAKARIEAAKKFLGRSDARLSQDARVQVEMRLKEAAEAFSSGDADVSQGNAIEASSHFDSALDSATKIEAIVSVSKNTDGSVNLDAQNDGSSESSGRGDSTTNLGL